MPRLKKGTSVPADYEEAISRERKCKTETTEQGIRGRHNADNLYGAQVQVLFKWNFYYRQSETTHIIFKYEPKNCPRV